MNAKLFLEKYYTLLDKIEAIDSLYGYDEFYLKLYDQLFYCMARYYNFITEYSDETPGARAVQTIHRITKMLNLPIKEFKVPSRALHIFYKEQDGA